jgi:mannose-6-phosphate isomerase-like protein (cupin superfamily)
LIEWDPATIGLAADTAARTMGRTIMAEQTMRKAMRMFRATEARSIEEMPEVFRWVMDEAATAAMPRWDAGAGASIKMLLGDPNQDGMSLMLLWFGSNFVLPRHVHDADCMYYILWGEARLGNQVLTAGDGLFVPAGAPYTYTAGPEGVEVLEFRMTSSVELRYAESPERWEKLIKLANESRDRWTAEGASHR